MYLTASASVGQGRHTLLQEALVVQHSQAVCKHDARLQHPRMLTA